MERSLFGQVWQDKSEWPSDSVAKGNYHNQRVTEDVPCRIKAVLLNLELHLFQLGEETQTTHSLQPISTCEEHLLVMSPRRGARVSTGTGPNFPVGTQSFQIG